MKKLNWKIIIIVVIVIVIISLIVWYYNKNKTTINITSTSREVKCVTECASDEICIKGACVKKKITYYN